MGEEKSIFRAAALEKRDSLTAGQRRDYSDRIIKKLTNLSCYREADAVLTYVSFRSEVDTIPLIEQAYADGKAVFAPKVTGKEMEFYRIFSLDDLSAGYRGILEPTGELSFYGRMTDRTSQTILVCMPGAAFDRARHRIGYGGGFYDRYLSGLLRINANTDAAAKLSAGSDATAHSQANVDTAGHLQRKVTTAALAYDCQIFEEIPWEPYDVCPERIITETKII